MAFRRVVRVVIDRTLRKAATIEKIVGSLAGVAVGVIEAGAAWKRASVAGTSNAIGIGIVWTGADTGRKG